MAAAIRFLELGSDLKSEAVPADAVEFLTLLGGPAFLYQRGIDSSRTRIVSTLLHGNEPSGIHAVQSWLRSGQQPAVNGLFFVGAVETALGPPHFHYRFLPGRRDFNRCWLPPFEGPEADIAHEALRLMRESGAECLLDIHNNTGHNPPYGVGPVPGAAELNLVSLFGERFVHSPLQLGTLVEATKDDFPSVTVECGRSGDPRADAIAASGLTRYLSATHLELRRPGPHRIDVLTDPVRVCVRDGIELAYADAAIPGAGLTVALDVDRHNFEKLPPGTPLGWLGGQGAWPVEALGEGGTDLSRDLFEVKGDQLVSRRSIIPIMMTTNRANALSDCLFYVVKRGAPVGSD